MELLEHSSSNPGKWRENTFSRSSFMSSNSNYYYLSLSLSLPLCHPFCPGLITLPLSLSLPSPPPPSLSVHLALRLLCILLPPPLCFLSVSLHSRDFVSTRIRKTYPSLSSPLQFELQSCLVCGHPKPGPRKTGSEQQ